MPKYFLNEDHLTPQELYLGLIANEIAEANRLKRIELEILNGENQSGHNYLTDKKLDDRA